MSDLAERFKKEKEKQMAKKAEQASTEIATAAPSTLATVERIRVELPILETENRENMGEIIDAYKEAVGQDGDELGAFMTVKVPPGGGLFWEVDGEPYKELEGVVLAYQMTRAYWEQSLEDGGRGRPDCISKDGKVGDGMYGVNSIMANEYNTQGLCANCPMAQFEEDSNGNLMPSMCKPIHNLFLMTDLALLPLRIALTGVSYAVWRDFTVNLSRKGIYYYGMKVKLGLQEDVSKRTNMKFAKLKPSFISALDREQVKEIKLAQGSFMAEILKRDDVFVAVQDYNHRAELTESL